MIARLSCGDVRGTLEPLHDGELASDFDFDTQIAVEAHLSVCAECAERLHELRTIRDLIRSAGEDLASSTDANPGSAAEVATTLPALLASVVSQAAAEKREYWPEQVGRMVLEGPRVWIPGGALAVNLVGAALLATILSLFTPTNTRSLAAILDPGSNENPVMVARGVSLPQVSLDAGLALLLSEPLTLPRPNVALAAVVTREGAVSRLQVLSPLVFAEELVGNLSRLTTDVRFKPARYGGAPVAVNVVWLFEQTTVRPPNVLS